MTAFSAIQDFSCRDVRTPGRQPGISPVHLLPRETRAIAAEPPPDQCVLSPPRNSLGPNEVSEGCVDAPVLEARGRGHLRTPLAH